MMKEYEVTITWLLLQNITVEAPSREEAMEMAEDMWNEGEIPVDADDCIDVNFSADEGREIDRHNEIDVVLVKPGEYARTARIGSELSDMKKIVGGDIQAVYYFDEPVALICNDEGKINGSELNRAIKDKSGKVTDIIAGTFFICGIGEDKFTSLQPVYRDKFKAMFEKPEVFLKMGKGIMAIPVEPKASESRKEAKAIEPKKHGQELRNVVLQRNDRRYNYRHP